MTAYLGVCVSAVLRLQTLLWVAFSSRMQEESSAGSHSTREHDRGISCRGARPREMIQSQAALVADDKTMMSSRRSS